MQLQYYPNEVGLSENGNDEFLSQPGYLSELTLPDGKSLLYKYDYHRNLTKIIYDDGTSRQYHYDNDEVYPTRLSGITNRLGVRYIPGCSTCPEPDMRYTNNDNFQVSAEVRNDGTQTRYTYDAEGRVTDRNGLKSLRQQFVYKGNTVSP